MQETDGSEKKASSIYKDLPKELGGTSKRGTAVDVGALLPEVERRDWGAQRKGMNDMLTSDEMNESIRHKVFYIEGQPPQPSKKKDEEKKEKERQALKSVRRNPKRRRPNGNKIVLSAEESKYEIFKPLLHLWLQYATKLRRDDVSSFPSRVPRMDLHGAPVRVLRSKDPGLVGVTGILVAETANTVLVITEKDKAVTVPKSVSVIAIKFDGIEVELFLPALAFRASERSARKTKKKHIPNI